METAADTTAEATKEATATTTTTNMDVDSTSTPKNGGDEQPKKADDTTTTNMEIDSTTATPNNGEVVEKTDSAADTTAEDKATAAATPNTNPKKRPRKSPSSRLSIDPLGLPKSVKRERKSVEIFEAVNFKTEGRKSEGGGGNVLMKEGRGTKLSDIPSVCSSIKASKMKGADLATAHNLVFGGRGKDRVKKQQLLDFSGYLPLVEEGTDKKKQKEIDEGLEKKFGLKAIKLTMPVLKRVCDLFDVDRSAQANEKVDKDFLVDRLLDFLALPSETLTKAYLKEVNQKARAKASAAKKKTAEAAKKETPTKKKKVKRKSKSPGRKKVSKKVTEEESSDEEMSSEEDESEEDEDTAPSDKALQKWVKAYVRCFSHDKATTKHAVDTAADKFGVDMSSQKSRIKELLTQAVRKKTTKSKSSGDDAAAVAEEEKATTSKEEEKTTDTASKEEETSTDAPMEEEKVTDAPKEEEKATDALKEDEKATDAPATATTSEDKPNKELEI